MQAYDRASADAEKALELNPDSGEGYAILGEANLSQENWEAATSAYTKAIDLGYVSAEIYAARGWGWQHQRYILYSVKDYDEALSEGMSGPDFLYRYGFALFDAKRYDDALEALLGAVNEGMDTADAHAILGVALDANHREDEADSEYQRAIDLDSQYTDTDFLNEQPLWSAASIQRAGRIIKRLDQ